MIRFDLWLFVDKERGKVSWERQLGLMKVRSNRRMLLLRVVGEKT